MDSLLRNSFFVIIPAYNEGKNIGQIIEGVKRYTDNIIIVDDGSQDQTYHKAKESIGDGVILKHKINLGKGAALKTGCEAAIKLGAKTIIAMDGDGQHNPDDIPKLIAKLEDENLDIVFGSRKLDRKVPLLRALGNKLLTKIVVLLFHISIHDILSGFKIFTSDAYRKIRWQSSDYSVEAEMVINAGKNKLRYGEIAIKTIYRDNYKGMNILSGIKILFNILKWNL